jgi:hypothetical protein
LFTSCEIVALPGSTRVPGKAFEGRRSIVVVIVASGSSQLCSDRTGLNSLGLSWYRWGQGLLTNVIESCRAWSAVIDSTSSPRQRKTFEMMGREPVRRSGLMR